MENPPWTSDRKKRKATFSNSSCATVVVFARVFRCLPRQFVQIRHSLNFIFVETSFCFNTPQYVAFNTFPIKGEVPLCLHLCFIYKRILMLYLLFRSENPFFYREISRHPKKGIVSLVHILGICAVVEDPPALIFAGKGMVSKVAPARSILTKSVSTLKTCSEIKLAVSINEAIDKFPGTYILHLYL